MRDGGSADEVLPGPSHVRGGERWPRDPLVAKVLDVAVRSLVPRPAVAARDVVRGEIDELEHPSALDTSVDRTVAADVIFDDLREIGVVPEVQMERRDRGDEEEVLRRQTVCTELCVQREPDLGSPFVELVEFAVHLDLVRDVFRSEFSIRVTTHCVILSSLPTVRISICFVKIVKRGWGKIKKITRG